MPRRLRPKVELSAAAILVGDPGRSLLLAQELLEQPRMSNHARGLWGYAGRTPAGDELTIQATGMGGPSAALVVADLAELGVERVVRVGTCVGRGGVRRGELLLACEALATPGSAASFGVASGETVPPDPDLRERLGRALGAGAQAVTVTSFDSIPAAWQAGGDAATAADMQTLAVFARARALGLAAAGVLIVTEVEGEEPLEGEQLDAAAAIAGRAAALALPNP